MSSEQPARPPWRNPFVWAFVAGIALVTLAAPRFRKIAPVPEVTATPRPFVLQDQTGQPFGSHELAGRVALVGLLTRGEPGAASSIASAFAELEPRFGVARARVTLVLLDLDGLPAGERSAWLASHAPAGADWHVASGRDACMLAADAFVLGDGGCDAAILAARDARVALLDSRGQVRGLHGTGPASLYETFEKTLRACDLAVGAR